jgi:3'(2'), 5'-bisphosphate nucleotidase
MSIEARISPVSDRVAMEVALVDSALRAGAAIMAIYDAGCDVEFKKDDSPVTAADAAGEAIILKDLAALAPHVPVVAEEEAAAGRIPDCDQHFFLVDPLDGTKEFIQRRGDFTVNIALVEHCAPTFGVVYAPARAEIFVGDVERGIAWAARVAHGVVENRRTLAVRTVPSDGLSVVASKSHNTPETDAYLALFPIKDRVSCGSSLKFCLVASGTADLYPRLAPTMEWDTGAGDAVLRAAGGHVQGPDGGPLRYNKERFFNPGFVASSRSIETPPIGTYLAANKA